MQKNFLFYDIETLPHDFTITLYDTNSHIAYFFVDSMDGADAQHVSRVDKEAVKAGIMARNSDIKDVQQITDYHAVRNLLLYPEPDDPRYRGGWNCAHFDLPVLYALTVCRPVDARKLANDIIDEHIPTWRLTDPNALNANGFQQTIDYNEFKKVVNAWYEIDIASLNEKSSEVDGKTRTPASLKLISAYAGLDVLDDALTRIDFKQWSKEYYEQLDPSLKQYINADATVTTAGLTNLLVYNFQDTYNTGLILDQSEYIDSFRTKYNLIEKYQINKKEPVANAGATSARVSQLILSHNDPNTFQDSSAVAYDFPLDRTSKLVQSEADYIYEKADDPDHVYINLLEYAHRHKIIPPVVYDFYKAFEGANVETAEGAEVAFGEFESKFNRQAEEHYGYPVFPKKRYNEKGRTNGTVTVPFFDRNLKPINSYTTFSSGGAHGSTMINYQDCTFEFARMLKITTDKKTGLKVYDNEIQKETLDTDAWAIDVGSFYPTFLTRLGIYKVNGHDPYGEIRAERLKLKSSLPADRSTWTDTDRENNRIQMDAKLILNSATGASNTRRANALLALDNKIVSMRMMGNMLIYIIATAFVRKWDARVLSTNTDGIEITFSYGDFNPSKDELDKFCKILHRDFGFLLEPERLDRFIVKDTNNRLEYHGNELNKVSGKLGKGFYRRDKVDGRIKLNSRLDHPMVVDQAIIAYLSSHRNFPDTVIYKPRRTKTYEILPNIDIITWLRDWITNLAKTDFRVVDWLVFTKGTRQRKFYFNGELAQDNNRYIFSQSTGSVNVTSTMKGKPTVITGWPSNQCKVLNRRSEMLNVTSDDLDLEPYVQWAYITLTIWSNHVVNKRPDDYKTNPQVVLFKKTKAKRTSKKKMLKSKAATATSKQEQEQEQEDARLVKLAWAAIDGLDLSIIKSDYLPEDNANQIVQQTLPLDDCMENASDQIDNSKVPDTSQDSVSVNDVGDQKESSEVTSAENTDSTTNEVDIDKYLAQMSGNGGLTMLSTKIK